MNFPAEIIEIIASYLSSTDQYQGLIVCKNWYQPFCRSLYQHIEFKNRHQLKKWFNCQHKYLVRSVQFGRFEKYNYHQQQDSVDRATGAIPLYSIDVGVTSNELTMVLNELPLLESMQFDSRLWQYLNATEVQKTTKNRLLALPALDHPRQLSFIQSKRGLMMSRLHLRGSDMFQLHKKDMFLNIFQFTPNLIELVIDADGMGDSKYAMPFSMQNLETLHLSLPSLKTLYLIDSVRLIEPNINDGSEQELSAITTRSTKLTELHLSVLIDKYAVHQWLGYFSYKYPQLTNLTLLLSSPYQMPRQQVALENQEKLALASFINKLPLLKKLVIDKSMSKLYLSDSTISSNNKHLNQLQLGLWGDNVETTNRALQCVTMNRIIVNSIFHLCIPLWSSENSIDFSVLNSLHQLTHLELIDKSGQQQKQSNNNDTIFSDERNSGYPINIILKSCPNLINLKLNNGQIIANTHQQEVQLYKHLKSIRMDRVEISETNDLFNYLSVVCPNLTNIFLRRCTSENFDLVLPNLKLTQVVLSELKQYPNQQLDHLTLLQQQQKNSKSTTDIRLYKSCQHQQTFRPYIRRLKRMQNSHIYLQCQSVDQLIFNGCRI
jgi:hypothetical protein